MSKTKLSIIIPSYNEQKTIIQTLKRIKETKSAFADYEVIVINDGSTDDTSSLLKSNSELYNHLIDYEKNFGKGYAVKKGLSIATGDYIIFQDADLEYDPKDFSKFIYLINKFNADVIIGSRISYSDFTRSHNFFNKLGNHVLTFIFNLFNNTTFTDIFSCYLCFKANLVNPEQLKTVGFESHAEILCKAITKGKYFYEVPINYNGRNQEEGKKIRYYHFFICLYRIIFQKFVK
jgi:glycosyltransferase involved in cell wall biosynthesis